MPLTRVGTTNVYAGVAQLAHGTAFTWHYEVGTRHLGGGQLEAYETHPDSREQPGVPKGTVKQMPPWESKIFAGTKRDWWVYVPAQYRPESPAAVMVFQDGAGPKDYVPTVFDNLIAEEGHAGHGRHLHPARHRARTAEPTAASSTTRCPISTRGSCSRRSCPEVEKTVKLRHDAASRAISGASSGGICAFTVAWERPNEFSKVLSWIGSFTNIASGKTVREGGHNYEAMVRKTPAQADPRVPAGRLERSRQRERQLAAREPDAGEVAVVCAATTTASSSARASTAIVTAARSCRTRCAGCGGATK